jgi:sarcosine oxidase
VPDSTFFVELPHGAYYGFPCLDGSTVKLAEHTGGKRIADPLLVDRALAPEDTLGPTSFINEVLPSLSAQPLRHSVCMYTMTDDAQFLIDRHPEHQNVIFATGFSGHGFKFMSAMGAIVTELAIDGETESAIDFLSLDRFST